MNFQTTTAQQKTQNFALIVSQRPVFLQLANNIFPTMPYAIEAMEDYELDRHRAAAGRTDRPTDRLICIQIKLTLTPNIKIIQNKRYVVTPT